MLCFVGVYIRYAPHVCRLRVQMRRLGRAKGLHGKALGRVVEAASGEGAQALRRRELQRASRVVKPVRVAGAVTGSVCCVVPCCSAGGGDEGNADNLQRQAPQRWRAVEGMIAGRRRLR